MKYRALLLIFFVLCSFSVYADLFADVTITVSDRGYVTIEGNTNYEPLIGGTSKLTSKSGEVWLLNITSPVFTEYLYRIDLPKDAIITQIISEDTPRIEQKSGVLRITQDGANKSIDIAVRYILNEEPASQNLAIPLIVAAVIVIAIIISKLPKKHKHKINRDLYTDRQLMIIDYLQKHGAATQIKLERELDIPKASLSRYLDSLAKKGVIYKENKGMSNIIGLKKE